MDWDCLKAGGKAISVRKPLGYENAERKKSKEVGYGREGEKQHSNFSDKGEISSGRGKPLEASTRSQGWQKILSMKGQEREKKKGLNFHHQKGGWGCSF